MSAICKGRGYLSTSLSFIWLIQGQIFLLREGADPPPSPSPSCVYVHLISVALPTHHTTPLWTVFLYMYDIFLTWLGDMMGNHWSPRTVLNFHVFPVKRSSLAQQTHPPNLFLLPKTWNPVDSPSFYQKTSEKCYCLDTYWPEPHEWAELTHNHRYREGSWLAIVSPCLCWKMILYFSPRSKHCEEPLFLISQSELNFW